MSKDNLPVYSYSRIRCYYSCPYSFYKKYYEKPDVELAEHGTTQFGSYVHSILEAYEKGELEEFELVDYYEEHFYENINATFSIDFGRGFSRDMSEKYFTDGKEYLENFDGFRDLNILEAEYEFEIPIMDTFNLVGKIDLVAQNKDGELVVIDHKSKGKFKNKAELAEYARQLYLYSYAIKDKYGRFPDKLAFNMFRIGEWKEFKFDFEDYKKAVDWSIDSVNEIEQAIDFPAYTDTFYCRNFCDYRLSCEQRNNILFI